MSPALQDCFGRDGNDDLAAADAFDEDALAIEHPLGLGHGYASGFAVFLDPECPRVRVGGAR